MQGGADYIWHHLRQRTGCGATVQVDSRSPLPPSPSESKQVAMEQFLFNALTSKTGTISPQLQKPALATNVTCAGLVGAHKGT